MAAIRRTPVDAWIAKRLGIKTDDLSQEKLVSWQIEAFRRTMRYAKEHSRFYRKHFCDFEPDRIQTMRDIGELPFTSETDLSGNELDFQCIGHNGISRIVTVPTTGTSNKIKRLGFTLYDQKQAMTFIGVGFETMCAPGDSMLIMMSGSTDGSIGDLVTRALTPAGVETHVYGTVGLIADAYDKISEIRPNVIVGVPNQLAALARYGERIGNPEKKHIHSVLASADFLPQTVRDIISGCWECEVFNHYGMTEMCIAGGVECRGFSGYHTRDCDLLFEVAEADTTGFGEVIITTLDREGMPLIRYRTGDLARFTQEACPCGSPLKRLECIYSRKRNVILAGENFRISLTDIANAVYSEPRVIDYECVLSGNNSDVALTVKTLPGESADAALIRTAIMSNVDIAGAVAGGKLRFDVSAIETDAFPNAGGTKKTLFFNK